MEVYLVNNSVVQRILIQSSNHLIQMYNQYNQVYFMSLFRSILSITKKQLWWLI